MLAAASEAMGFTSPAVEAPTSGMRAECAPMSTEGDSEERVESEERKTEDVVEAPVGGEKADEPDSVEATVGAGTAMGIRSDHGDGMSLLEHFQKLETRLNVVERQLADYKVSSHRQVLKVGDHARKCIAEMADNGELMTRETKDFILAANSLLQRDDAEAAALLRRR